MSHSSEEDRHPGFARMAAVGKVGADAGNPMAVKKRRNPPGNPDPNAEVVALSPRTLLATNRYICEVCHKGFQRDQNLQLHRRGHNLPWKLKQRTSAEVKKRVYVCPETSCAHHDPNRALGDLTGIKKHYSRKHGEKKWKCDKCLKRYAVQSDWKAHSKICGTKEYRCDCGTIFSRKDSFVTHRAFCDALNEENFRASNSLASMVGNLHSHHHDMISHSMPTLNSSIMDSRMNSLSSPDPNKNKFIKRTAQNPLLQASSNLPFDNGNTSSSMGGSPSSFLSATALLQKAAEMGAKVSDESISPALLRNFAGFRTSATNSCTNNNIRSRDSYSELSSEGGSGRFMASVTAGGSGKGSGFGTGAGHDPFLGRRREAGEDNGERRNGRMTQDFLGLGGSGSKSAGNQSCNEEDIYSYGQSSWGKQMWDY